MNRAKVVLYLVLSFIIVRCMIPFLSMSFNYFFSESYLLAFIFALIPAWFIVAFIVLMIEEFG